MKHRFPGSYELFHEAVFLSKWFMQASDINGISQSTMKTFIFQGKVKQEHEEIQVSMCIIQHKGCLVCELSFSNPFPMGG